MNVDTFFTIGSTHKICQDYVLHGTNDNPYVILSDGCSSSPDSDFGSRILCKSLQPLIYNFDYNINSLLDAVFRNAHNLAKTMVIEDDALCATLVFCRIENGFFKTYSVGDSVIAAKDKSGTVHFIEYEFASGAPYYLRYEIDNMKEGYFAKFGKEVYRKTSQIYNRIPVGVEISLEAKEQVEFDKIYFEEKFAIEDYEWVAIMSDGASSFQQLKTTSTTKQNVSVTKEKTLYQQILAFKGYFGEFVQRRCQKAFKEFDEQNIHNYDDFSIGVITTL